MIIVIQCSDKVGLVANIATALAKYQLNITSMREYVDQTANKFFARLVVDGQADHEALYSEFSKQLPPDAQIKINPNPNKSIIVLVTKEYHCLSDILTRNHFDSLGAKVIAVLGNHLDLENICKRYEIPFHYVGHEGKTKQQFEGEVLDKLSNYKFDYLILAKFMRILSPHFISNFPLRIINIHHSFLPAFVGAHPYKKAFERGVKIIGATAHFVTNDLDEGPIITQKVISVNHTFEIKDLVKAGRESETAALSRAMQLVFEDRVFVFDNKTVVFE